MVLVRLKMVGAACGHTPSAQRCLYFFVERIQPGKACQPPRLRCCLSSVEECDVRHLARRVLGVHPDAVPLVQGDRRVVAMTHSAARIHLRIPEADLPAPARGTEILRDRSLVALSRESRNAAIEAKF